MLLYWVLNVGSGPSFLVLLRGHNLWSAVRNYAWVGPGPLPASSSFLRVVAPPLKGPSGLLVLGWRSEGVVTLTASGGAPPALALSRNQSPGLL